MKPRLQAIVDNLSRQSNEEILRDALKDARENGATIQGEWDKRFGKQFIGKSLVNYATAPMGSMKYDASTLGR